MKIFHQTVPFFTFLIYIFVMYKIGIIKGLILIYLFYKIYDCIMLKIFKLQRLTPGDLTFVWSKKGETYDIIMALPIDKMNIEEMRNLIIEKGLKKIRRLRSKLTYRFLEWWWQEVPLEESIKRIELRDAKSAGVFKTKEDFLSYANKELSIKFDLENELPFKFLLYTNEQEDFQSEFKNILVIKMNHIVTDGLDAIKFICSIADNYDKSLFPAVMTKPIPLKYKILMELLTPFYFFLLLYRITMILKPVKTIFKTDLPISGAPLMALSEKINFRHFNEINKQLNITFNDLMASVLASAFKNYSKIVCDKSKDPDMKVPPYVLMVSPVGFNTLSENLNDIDLCNNSTGLGNKIKLVDDDRQEFNIVSNDFGKITRNVYLAKATKRMTDVMFYFLPYYCSRFLIKNFYKNCDITISNVPGPRDNLIYAGSKVLDIIPIATTGFSHVFTGILSYCGHFRIIICFDTNLNLCPDTFLDCINKELNKISENYGNNLNAKKIN